MGILFVRILCRAAAAAASTKGPPVNRFAAVVVVAALGMACRADDVKIASADVTKWEVGMVFKFPPAAGNKYYEIAKVINKKTIAVVGIEDFNGSGRLTTWFQPFALKTDASGLVENKQVKMDGVYKVVGTVKASVRRFPAETHYLIEEVKK
jgi:hypothetical protein